MTTKRKNKTTGSTYQWFNRFSLVFTDLLEPTGWMGDNVSKAYTEEITESEFIRRLKESRVDTRIQSFLKGYKRLWKETDEVNET